MRRFIYMIKQAFVQIGRNKNMAFASTIAITAMLLILSLSFLAIVNINTATEVVKKDYDRIQLFLKDDLTQEQGHKVRDTFAFEEGVKRAAYQTKEEAMRTLKARWGNSGYLLDNLRKNPLPNSVIITVSKLETADKIAEKAKKTEGVEDIKYYKKTVEKLIKATRFIQWSALVIILFLIFICIVVVSNTIKLTVFARSDEISIMKYVGATNWFVRGPFLLEGMLIGLISGAIAVGLSTFIYIKIVSTIGKNVITILSTPMVPVEFLAGSLAWILIALGMCIGATGSIASMRRFLKE